ncbi:hypothetical protein [Pseudonocardia hydrocarbonoxydans]|uniref:Uncharacterized protein n=1 Tax=Pseudonocardia hydrocarbonoxydans TaxID=76726 RepID=A0A4Y3WU21_9PSEU|nr:hypothetical protein [Pseudonocardia hydrocarbonoxydans]GEC22274.1 hypothetical protein PHY01_45570 [Pseudonocardia hydrocarbonoxydans]
MSECYAPEPVETYPTESCETETEHPIESGHGSSYEYVDHDGDGYAETTEIDSNGDGEVDTVLVDVDGDYYDDIAAFDNSPGDGTFVPDVVAVAADGDGLADVIFDDVNFDGVFDTVTPGHDEPLAYANPYEVSAGQAPLDARS